MLIHMLQWKVCFILSRFQKSRLKVVWYLPSVYLRTKSEAQWCFKKRTCNWSSFSKSMFEFFFRFSNFSILASAICLSIWTICLFFSQNEPRYVFKENSESQSFCKDILKSSSQILVKINNFSKVVAYKKSL